MSTQYIGVTVKDAQRYQGKRVYPVTGETAAIAFTFHIFSPKLNYYVLLYLKKVSTVAMSITMLFIDKIPYFYYYISRLP
jgi:hypothetical protein